MYTKQLLYIVDSNVDWKNTDDAWRYDPLGYMHSIYIWLQAHPHYLKKQVGHDQQSQVFLVNGLVIT